MRLLIVLALCLLPLSALTAMAAGITDRIWKLNDLVS